MRSQKSKIYVIQFFYKTNKKVYEMIIVDHNDAVTKHFQIDMVELEAEVNFRKYSRSWREHYY
jgi:hypothetical protein